MGFLTDDEYKVCWDAVRPLKWKNGTDQLLLTSSVIVNIVCFTASYTTAILKSDWSGGINL